MTFSLTGIYLNLLKDYKSIFRVSTEVILLNFVVQGILLLVISYFIFEEHII